ncbi:MAG: tetratricopeptide (TPR) repeat protein [Crocinitomix sp.]|jgi:tetratricopeptide (TPR) repeat protein
MKVLFFVCMHILSFSAMSKEIKDSNSHRFYTDTVYTTLGRLALTNPKKALLIAQEKFRLSNDYIYKLIEVQYYQRSSNYSKAAEICYDALKRKQVQKDYFITCAFYFELGNLNHEIQDYQHSLDWYEKGYNLGKKVGDLNLQITGNSGMALAYQGLGNNALAKKKYLYSIELHEQFGIGYTFERYSCESNLGGIFLFEEAYDSAYIRYNRAYNFFAKEEHYEFASYSSSGIAICYLEWNEIDSTEKYLNISLNYAKKLDDSGIISHALSNMAAFYQEIKAFEKSTLALDSSLHYFKIYKQKENLAAVNSLKVNYDLEKKVMELNNKSLELEKSQLESKASEQFKTLIGLILFIIVLILGAMIYILKVNRKKQEIDLERRMSRLEMKALQAQMNPHFIFNCLSSIQHLFLAGKEKEANHYMSLFSNLLRTILEYSKVDEISLEDELKMLKLYCNLENLQFDKPFELEVSVEMDVSHSQIEIPTMLFQPFVENAINHGLKNSSHSGKLKISFSMEGNILIGEIEDNGVGRERAGYLRNKLKGVNYKSRGMEITNERAALFSHIRKLNINMEIIDKYDNANRSSGTKVRIEIPIK